MNCRVCGSPLPTGAKVCPHCGTRILPPSPQPDAQSSPYAPPAESPPPADATLPAAPANPPRQMPPTAYGSNAYHSPPAGQPSAYTPPPAVNPSFGDQRQAYGPPSSANPPFAAQPQSFTPPSAPGSALPQQAGSYPAYPPPFPPGGPQEQKKPTRRFPAWIAVLVIVLILLLIAGSGLIYYAGVYQPNLMHTHATATAMVQQTGTAQAHATATSQARATATAAAQNPYTHTGTLVYSDSLKDNSGGHRWDVNTNCAFKDGTYHAIAPNPLYSDYCNASATNFINFTLEVQMQVIQGDGGAVSFRVINTSSVGVDQFYEFYVFRDGGYGLDVVNDGVKSLANGSNAPVNPNLNDINVIGVVAQGTTLTVYVNHQQVASVNDGTYSHGRIGVQATTYANGGHATEVAYSNMRVWAL